MKRLILIFAALAAAVQLNAQHSQEVKAVQSDAYVQQQGSYMPDFKIDGKESKVKNVILIIGDGMGLGAVCAAMYANGGELTLTNLRTMGYVKTHAANNFGTDSAASGTAYATGHKTNNGSLGVDTCGVALPNIPEILTPLGYACGIVSNDPLYGATPAAFFAHQVSRKNKAEIWMDMASSPLAFFSAGTKFSYLSQPLATREAIEKNFSIMYEVDEEMLRKADKLGYLPEKAENNPDFLVPTTRMALDYLSARAKKGFFLMIEGAHIDHRAHSNNTDELMTEMLDFDKAVTEAIKFAEKDGQTLVIISADHETGGVVLRKGDAEEGYIQTVFASKGHTPDMVPLFAYGPKSRNFGCVQENSDVCNKILKILGAR